MDPTANKEHQYEAEIAIDRFAGGFTNNLTGADKLYDFDRKKSKLRREFLQFDLNGDGMVSKQEFMKYIYKNLGLQEDDEDIFNSMFRRMDANADGDVELEEFTNFYMNEENRLKTEILKCKRRLEEKDEELAYLQHNLENTAPDNEQRLIVKVIKARDLRPMDLNGMSDPYCKLFVEGQEAETRIIPSNLNPEWNEVISFDIQSNLSNILAEDDDVDVNQKQLRLKVWIFDKDTMQNDDLIGRAIIPLRDLRDQKEQTKWYSLHIPLDKENIQPVQGRIYLSCQLIYSNIELLRGVIFQKSEERNENLQEIETNEAIIALLDGPFSFLATAHSSSRGGTSTVRQGVEFVKSLKVGLDSQLAVIGKSRLEKWKFKHLPWEQVTLYASLIYIGLTLFVMLYRTDLVNLCISVGIMYGMHHNREMGQQIFKYLIYGIIFSLLSDVLWFVFFGDDWMHACRIDGGLEGGIRKFTLAMCFLSFCFRFFMIIILWKDYLDYENMMKEQKNMRQPPNLAPGGMIYSPHEPFMNPQY